MIEEGTVFSSAQFDEVRTLIDQLLGAHAEPKESSGSRPDADEVDSLLSDLRKLVEVKILRQLPAARFQELLASAVAQQWYDSVINAINEMLIVIFPICVVLYSTL